MQRNEFISIEEVRKLLETEAEEMTTRIEQGIRILSEIRQVDTLEKNIQLFCIKNYSCIDYYEEQDRMIEVCGSAKISVNSQLSQNQQQFKVS